MTRLRHAALISLVGLATLACDSATAPPVDVPAGVSVVLNGTIVARELDSRVEGGLHLHYGEYSGVFVVDILNGRGESMPLDGDHRLEVAVGDTSLVTFVQATPGAFQGEFEIFDEGETTVTFRLVRAGSETPEWTSLPFDLFVVAC